MAITDILKVLYAPHKVFKEIAKKPSYLAPFIVLIIFLIAQVSASYIVTNRSFIEQTYPSVNQMDALTEHAANWTAASTVSISENHLDYINASAYYNTTSIEFIESNSSSLQMALASLDGSVNCGADGYKSLSFKAKIVEPTAKPTSVTLYLYSVSDANFFSYDITPQFSNGTATDWSNVSVPVGSEAWLASGTPDWTNITSLQLAFTWTNASNIDLRLDGLFFRGIYATPLAVYGSTYLISSVLNAATQFLFQWLVLTAIMFLVIKGLKGNAVWKPLMVAVGVALTILIVEGVVLVVLYSTLPNLYYPIEVLAGVLGEFEAAYQVLANAISAVTVESGILQIVILAWNIGLGVFVVRAVTSTTPTKTSLLTTTEETTQPAAEPQPLSWSKCLFVSGVGVLVTLIILYFLGI